MHNRVGMGKRTVAISHTLASADMCLVHAPMLQRRSLIAMRWVTRL